MSQHYSDESRADDKYSLPDVETFEAYAGTCPVCHSGGCIIEDDARDCGECANGQLEYDKPRALKWYYWYCFPGCLPDSSPMGPYDTEDEAIAAAREECSE